MHSLGGRLPGLSLVLGQKRYRHRHCPHPSPRHRHPPSLSLATFAMAIEVGDEFVDFKAFEAAMADWSITGKHKFTCRYQSPTKRTSCYAPIPTVPSASMQPWISAAAWLKRFSSIATIFACAICVEHLPQRPKGLRSSSTRNFQLVYLLCSY